MTIAAESQIETDWLSGLSKKWLQIPAAALDELGPPAQTLAGILEITRRETFVSVEKISLSSYLPVATVRKHLKTLASNGWINNLGRHKTARGATRRTCTIQVTSKAVSAARDEYIPMPLWACKRYVHGTFNWAERMVIAVIFRRLMSLASVEGGEDIDWDFVDKLGGNDRFRWSLFELEQETGLSRPSIIAAKLSLDESQVIDRECCHPLKDIIAPRRSFASLQYTLHDGTQQAIVSCKDVA
jgi:hypothetical protein